MLQQLFIQNIVIIESLHLDFTSHLSVFTGETGAGKSILLDSLGLVLGAKAETKLIREGCEQATVTAVFSLPLDNPTFDILEENGVSVDKNENLIIRRSISRSGGNKVFLNDAPISASLLKTISTGLVDIHGQFDTYTLMDERTHRAIVDKYGVDKKLLVEIKTAFENWKQVQKSYEDIIARSAKAKEDEEYYSHVYEELKNFGPELGEETSLEEKKQEFKSKEYVIEALNSIESALNGEQGADLQIGQATRVLERIAPKTNNPDVDALLDKMTTLRDQMADIVFEYQSLADSYQQNDENPEEIALRLLNLKELARKHQTTPDGLVAKLDEFSTKLRELQSYDETIVTLQKQMVENKKIYLSLAEKAHKQRMNVADDIDTKVMAELIPLKMEKAKFKTQIESLPEEHFNEFGTDFISFQISTNPGSPFGALKKVASGGELSRFMLALKVVLAKTDVCPTLIFDEADSGIGGATAHAVGERLKLLSQEKQVLVITHSPQVAACGRHHFHVSKTSTGNKTTTSVVELSPEQRLKEIARMLSGANITEEAQKAAEKLLADNHYPEMKKSA